MAYSQRYNSYLYCAKVRTLLRAIKDYQVQIENSEVLDVGSGTGFWIQWYIQAGASHVTGIEISQEAVEKLTREFPQAEFHALDICRPLPFNKFLM